MKSLRLGGRRARVPIFAATAADDERLWPWQRGVRPDAVLISYDVLRLDPVRTRTPVATTLGYDGLVVVDSGGYGTNAERSAAEVYRVQRAVGAHLGVVLDEVALSTQSAPAQASAIQRTLRNALAIRRQHRGSMALEAVIQGATAAQLEACGARMGALRFDVYGVPVSMQAKYRRYAAAVERVLHATAALPPTAVIHALGCGSRTLMAILSSLGVALFDSRSYYQRAMYGENIAGVTMCALGTPRNKPACGVCMHRHRPGRTLEARTDHNLHETLKEVIRVRCAVEEGATASYLRRRLGKTLFNQIALVVERLAPRGRRHTPFSADG